MGLTDSHYFASLALTAFWRAYLNAKDVAKCERLFKAYDKRLEMGKRNTNPLLP